MTPREVETLLRRTAAAVERRAYAAGLRDAGRLLKAAAHAPAGGASVQGRHYPGGQFIPSDVMDAATPAERAAVAGGTHPRPEAKIDGDNPRARARIQGVWEQVLGRAASLDEASHIVGAPAGAAVTVDSPIRSGVVTVTVTHPQYSARYKVGRDADGPHLGIDWIGATAGHDKGGVGAAVFARTVAGATDAGLASIRCHAAKANRGKPDQPYNGYYTWALFGFDQRLDDAAGILPHDTAAFAAAKEAFPAATHVQHLLLLPGGAEWWKAHGTDLTNARFDLAEGSISRTIFEAYQTRKREQSDARRRAAGGGDPGPDAGRRTDPDRGPGLAPGPVAKSFPAAAESVDDAKQLLYAAMLQVAERHAVAGTDWGRSAPGLVTCRRWGARSRRPVRVV